MDEGCPQGGEHDFGYTLIRGQVVLVCSKCGARG